MKQLAFKRWELPDASTVAPLFPEEERRGIYILEFADGERYVGQATNVVTRYSQHRHGSSQHSAWEDVVAIQFCSAPQGDLNEGERRTIWEQREHFTMRNRTFNYEHWEPTAFDALVEPEQQRHWATGDPEYSKSEFAVASRGLMGRRPKLLSSRRGQEVLPDGRQVWEAVVDELSQAVALVIPNAVETEGQFWMISDYPGTSRGRFATLNVGSLELLYFPRTRIEIEGGGFAGSNGLVSVLNANIETFIPYSDIEGQFAPDASVCTFVELDGNTFEFSRLPTNYSIPVDSVQAPLGMFGVQDLSVERLSGVRNLAIRAMRRGSARVNARSRNDALTRMVYERIAEPDFLNDHWTD